MQAVDTGLPIKVVYEAYQYAPEGIVVPDDSPIKSLADLKGATIGLASDRDQITTIIAMESIGKTLEDNDIKTVVVGDSGPVMAGALKDKTIDAFAGGSTDRAGIEAAGVKIRNITPAEVSRNPGQNLRRLGADDGREAPVITAFLRGWAMAQLAGVIDTKTLGRGLPHENPGAVRECRSRPQHDQRQRLYDAAAPHAEVRRAPARRLEGRSSRLTSSSKEISKELDPATFLDSSFIDAANDFTTDDVKNEDQAWKEANKDKLIN